MAPLLLVAALGMAESVDEPEASLAAVPLWVMAAAPVLVAVDDPEAVDAVLEEAEAEAEPALMVK